MNAYLVTHATEIFGPPHALLSYLRPKTETLVFISYPLDKNVNLKPSASLYWKGELVYRKSLPLLLERFPVSYLRDFLATFYFAVLLKGKAKFDYFIGANNLNCLAGILLKPLLKIKKTVFFTVDYSPRRFNNHFLDWLYHFIDKLAVRWADFTWSNTRRVAKIREDQELPQRKNLIVPNGVDLGKIPIIKKNKEEIKIVYIGHLTKTKGIQEIIKTLPGVLKVNQKFKFLIVGSGPYERELRNLAKKLFLGNKIQFLGEKTNEETLTVVSKCDIGVALYTKNDSYTYYCDPMKVKEYLACGCAVIVSNLPEIALEIKRKKLGVMINDFSQLSEAILLLAKEKNLAQMQERARKAVQKYSWEQIFATAFKKMEKE
jgi:glycosyltransferase involved in cell wall biosynthesis